ncbi:MAG: manganese efflux pump [Mailhella sp.]|nr:manganese efflux pump [Mailhella sp.]
MSFLSSFAIALALAMDAFAVSVSSSVSLRKVDMGHYFRMALAFGLFQFAMPVVGWLLGLSVRDYIEAWDHWIAFGLLSFVGLNMLREAMGDKEEECPEGDPSRGFTLILLAVATSIDALAVGLSFSMIGVSVWKPAVIIGLVCAGLTVLGVKLGSVLGRSELLGSKAAILGAVVLIVIGVKILYEHGVFSYS